MKIEHVEFYDYFDVFTQHVNQSALYDVDFQSIYDVAITIRHMLGTRDKPIYRQALVFLDNWRYLLVTPKSYDVHFHATFDLMQKQFDKPIFNNLK